MRTSSQVQCFDGKAISGQTRVVISLSSVRDPLKTHRETMCAQELQDKDTAVLGGCPSIEKANKKVKEMKCVVHVSKP